MILKSSKLGRAPLDCKISGPYSTRNGPYGPYTGICVIAVQCNLTISNFSCYTCPRWKIGGVHGPRVHKIGPVLSGSGPLGFYFLKTGPFRLYTYACVIACHCNLLISSYFLSHIFTLVSCGLWQC